MKIDTNWFDLFGWQDKGTNGRQWKMWSEILSGQVSEGTLLFF